jgi:hypothetical protein
MRVSNLIDPVACFTAQARSTAWLMSFEAAFVLVAPPLIQVSFPGDAGELPLDGFDGQKTVHLIKVFSGYVDSPHEDLTLAPDFSDSDC